MAENILAWPGSPSSEWYTGRTMELVLAGEILPATAAHLLEQRPGELVEKELEKLREQGVWNTIRDVASLVPGLVVVVLAVEGCWKLGQYIYETCPAIAACWDRFTAWIVETAETVWDTITDWVATVGAWIDGWFADAGEVANQLAGSVQEAASGLADEYEENAAADAEAFGDDSTPRPFWDQEEYEAAYDAYSDQQERSDAQQAEADAGWEETTGEEGWEEGGEYDDGSQDDWSDSDLNDDGTDDWGDSDWQDFEDSDDWGDSGGWEDQGDYGDYEGAY